MHKPSSESTNLFKIVEKADIYSRDLLESAAQGYIFPVHEKVRKMPNKTVYRDGNDEEGVSISDLLKTTLKSLSLAWENGIKPRLQEIRAGKIDAFKTGTDFFTEADIKSEEEIRNHFIKIFGEQSFRIFGEEANQYLGNKQSQIGVRIDPIDGTESFKFSKDADWGIMIGVYTGSPEDERQIIGAVYFPERQQLLYTVDGIGVFGSNFGEGPETQLERVGTKEYHLVPEQNDVKDIIITLWKHTDLAQRGNTQAIENELAQRKARIRSTNSSCAEVLEALESNGKRAIILDGDFNQVDFIPFTMLEKVGFKIYDWQGNERKADDVALANQKLVVVPPGRVGQEILKVIEGLN